MIEKFPLQAAKQVLPKETLIKILTIEELGARGWEILERWAIGWPDQAKEMVEKHGWWLLVNRLLQQQSVELEILELDRQHPDHLTRHYSDHYILSKYRLFANECLEEFFYSGFKRRKRDKSYLKHCGDNSFFTQREERTISEKMDRLNSYHRAVQIHYEQTTDAEKRNPEWKGYRCPKERRDWAFWGRVAIDYPEDMDHLLTFKPKFDAEQCPMIMKWRRKQALRISKWPLIERKPFRNHFSIEEMRMPLDNFSI